MSKNKLAMLKRKERSNNKKRVTRYEDRKSKLKTRAYNKSLRYEIALADIDSRIFLFEKNIEAYNLQKEDLLKNSEDPNGMYIQSKIQGIDAMIANSNIFIDELKKQRLLVEENYKHQPIRSDKYDEFYAQFMNKIATNVMGMKETDADELVEANAPLEIKEGDKDKE